MHGKTGKGTKFTRAAIHRATRAASAAEVCRSTRRQNA